MAKLSGAEDIVNGYIRQWPRSIFHVKTGDGAKTLADTIQGLDNAGVYVLYMGSDIYYIGKTDESLRNRLRAHAARPDNKHFNGWDRFSAFIIPKARHRTHVEAILIAAQKTASISQPKLHRIRMPSEVAKHLREKMSR